MGRLGWSFAVLLSVPAAAHEGRSIPTVTAGYPQSLAGLFTFKPTDKVLERWGKSTVRWRFDVHLPHGTKIDPQAYVDRDANMLVLTDGRCFRAITSAALAERPQVVIEPTPCPAKQAKVDPVPQEVIRRGSDYRGRVYNLSAWTNTRSGVTEFADGNSPPVMTTTMQVIGLGGGGSPDTPHTAVLIQGYAKDQLVLCMVSIIES